MVKEVERNDHISGAIDYGKTALIRREQNSDNLKKVVCKEIQRSYHTPENTLLAIILFSIMVYCDRYISLTSLVLSKEKFDPTIRELELIRERVGSLLSSKRIKEIISAAELSLTNINNLFNMMLKRIQLERTPMYYMAIFNLFYKLKDYVKASQDELEVSKHVLQYYLLSLDNPNDLYECWVFCKVLDAIVDTYKNLKFKESTRSKGVMTISSDNGLIKITYQPIYDTEWKYNKVYLEDNPDIAIEFKNGSTIIFDAKNREYSRTSNRHQNRHQMDSYIRSANAKYGIFIHSRSDDPEVWEETQREGYNQTIVWTCLIPDKPSNNELEKIIQLILLTERGM
jgi:hypothetical protein